MTPAALRRRRAAAQLLDRHDPRTPADVVRALLAVQAQDLGAARLALRARSAGLAAADVDRALDEREVVVTWLCRGTLHLVCAENWAWLLSLTAPGRRAGNRRRLAQERVAPDDADRAVDAIERALADDGPLTRAQLAERVAAAGVRTEGQAMPHLLMLAALRGVAVGCGHQRFALARDWLADVARPGRATSGTGSQAGGFTRHAGAAQRDAWPPPVDRDAALAELARRYLRAHGPATAADLAGWAGLPLRDARAGLGAIAAELVADGGLVALRRGSDDAGTMDERSGDTMASGPVTAAADHGRLDDGTAESGRGGEADPPPVPPRLLPAFDPYLLGWRDRTFAVPPGHAKRVHPGGGMLRATAIDDGFCVATWTLPGGRVRLEPLAGDDADLPDLTDEIADVERFAASAT